MSLNLLKIDKSLNYGRHVIRDMLSSIKFKDNENSLQIIDVGAGAGTDLTIAREFFPAAQLHAVEVHEPYCNALVKKGFTVHKFDIERSAYPFKDNSVDIIIANQILEHTKDIFWIMHNVSRILKPGGFLLVGVPNIASLHSRIRLAFGYIPTSIRSYSAHVRGFTKGDFLDLLSIAYCGGYHLNSFGASGFYPLPRNAALLASKVAPNCSVSIFFCLKKNSEYNGEFISYPKNLQTNFFLG
jgi:SAM-dependent methyltransferase